MAGFYVLIGTIDCLSGDTAPIAIDALIRSHRQSGDEATALLLPKILGPVWQEYCTIVAQQEGTVAPMPDAAAAAEYADESTSKAERAAACFDYVLSPRLRDGVEELKKNLKRFESQERNYWQECFVGLLISWGSAGHVECAE